MTGGTGFTGAALVKRLLLEGHAVVSLDKQAGLVDEELASAGAQMVYGSITDRALVARCSEGVEAVMHLAAAFREVGVPDEVYRQVNVEGTRIVAEEALRAGARKFVYCSTQGVHGHIANPPGNEDSPIAPADYYQQTKYEGELEMKCLDGTPLEYTILRPTAIYGPGDPGRFQMIFRHVKKGVFRMFGSGQTCYHPVYVDNLVDAFLLVMEPGKGASQAYIIGDEQYFPIKELVRLVGVALDVDVRIPHYPIWPLVVAGHACEKFCKPLGIEPPIFPRRVDWFRQVRAFKIDKARQELGYQPRVDIGTGLRLTGEWYLSTGRI